MEKTKKLTAKTVILILVAIFVVCGGVLAGLFIANSTNKVPTTEKYNYVNPDETKAEADEGMKIDGVFDEEVYQGNNWLYLQNKEGGADVDIKMTSHFGEKGLYFAYDVTEGTPIYVNLERECHLNSSIEMYLVPSYLKTLHDNSAFEINMMPTGDVKFRKTNGKGGWVDVTSYNEIMAYVGTTTKGGPVNTEDCYGYTLELFVPYSYMEKFNIDTNSMKNDGYVYVNPTHITSYNMTGTQTNIDRLHYWFAQQIGAGWNSVGQFFRFDKEGIQGTVKAEIVQGENYTVEGATDVFPGLKHLYRFVPKKGYAISSIMVNGKEYVKDVNFEEDGTAVLEIRGRVDSMKISAETVVTTDKNVTVTGSVYSNKQGGDSLADVKVTYKGKTGTKPITIDAKGKFTLTNVKPGYYTFSVDKEGYKKVNRKILVNHDMDINLVLNWERFEVQKGTAWILDDQNNDLLMKFGGSNASILSKDSYKNFTIQANFRYDKTLPLLNGGDDFVQQRQGYRIAFSNDKTWHIDLLQDKGKYIIQYAKHSGDKSMTSWKTVYELTPEDIAKYTSKKGISFEIQRSGRVVNILLGGKTVVNEYLGKDYANLTAKLGFESWTSNRVVQEFPFKITTKKVSASSLFKATQGYDTATKPGVIITKNTADQKEDDMLELQTFLDTYRGISVTAKDAKNDGKYALVYIFRFNNGEVYPIRIMNLDNAKGVREKCVQVMAGNTFGNTIAPKWNTVTGLSDAQIKKLTGEGIEFGVSIIGETAHISLDGVEIGTRDLSKKKDEKTPSNIKNELATIGVKVYGNADVTVEMPYKLSSVVVNVAPARYGTVTLDKAIYNAGDTVVVTSKNDDGTPATQIKIDGKVVALDANGQTSFKAQAAGHNIEGLFKKKEIFAYSTTWDLSKEDQGVISTVGGSGGNYSTELPTKDNNYREIAIKVKDHKADNNFSIIAVWNFANGLNFTGRIAGDGNVQIMPSWSNSFVGSTQWPSVGRMSADQIAKWRSEGVEFKMSLVGETMYFFVDGIQIGTCDLSTTYAGKPSNLANVGAKITLRLDGNKGVNTEMPFTISEVAVVAPKSAMGTVTTDKTYYAPGDTITITALNKDGTPCTTAKVDGKVVTLDANGKYSFKAEKKGHVIEGNFAGEYFVYNTAYDLTKQDEGILGWTGKATSNGTFITTKNNTYRGMSVFVKDNDMHNKGFVVMVKYRFNNGQTLVVRLNNDGSVDEYVPQLMNSDGDTFVTNWPSVGSAFQQNLVNKVRSEGVEFATYIVGSELRVYIDGQFWGSRDLSKDQNGKPSGIENETATIDLRIDKNAGFQEIPFDLAETFIDTNAGENGKIVLGDMEYLLNEEVVATIKADNGYFCTELKVDGKVVDVPLDGVYKFKATKIKHTIEAVFDEAIFESNSKWDLSEQLNDKISVPGTDLTDSSWATTVGNYTGVEVVAKSHYTDQTNPPFATVLSLIFDNGKFANVRLIYEGKWKLQGMDSKGIFKWKEFYFLNNDEIAKVTGDGLKFKIVRDSQDPTKLDMYLDDKLVVDNADLTMNSSGVTKDSTAQARIRIYGNQGKDTDMTYKLFGGKEKITITVNDMTNGTIEPNKARYYKDEMVTLNLKGDKGYACNSLKINGQPVTPNANGTYTFKAEELAYTVDATFGKTVWDTITDKAINGESQLFGGMAVTNPTETGKQFASKVWTKEYAYREFTVDVKDQLGANNKQFAAMVTVKFSSNAVLVVRLHGTGGDPIAIQLMNSDGDTFVTSWKTLYTGTAAQTAKLRSEGLKFRVAIIEETAHFFIDGVWVASFDISKDQAGAPTNLADKKAQIGFRLDGNGGKESAYTFELGKEEPKKMTTPQLVAGANGTLKLDRDVYYANQVATVSAVPTTGYALKTLKVDGKAVTPTANGTYSFLVTKDDHKVEATFDTAVWTSTGTQWNAGAQFFGIMAVTNGDSAGATEYVTATGEYSAVSTTMKYVDGYSTSEVPFAATLELRFVYQSKVAKVKLIRESDGTLKLQLVGGNTSVFGTRPVEKNLEDLNPTLAATVQSKIATEGIKFEIKRAAKTIQIYVEDQLVHTQNMTATGITAATKTNRAAIGFDVAAKKSVEIKFTGTK